MMATSWSYSPMSQTLNAGRISGSKLLTQKLDALTTLLSVLKSLFRFSLHVVQGKEKARQMICFANQNQECGGCWQSISILELPSTWINLSMLVMLLGERMIIVTQI